MKDIVVICGANQLTRGLIDWSLDADFWHFNEGAFTAEVDPERWSYGKPISAVFQLHTPEIWRSDNGGHFKGYYKWLQQEHPYPIYMQEKYDDVPASVQYPFDKIALELLAGIFVDEEGDMIEYFSSTIEYMFALAIYQGAKEIHIYGVEASSGTEYERQRTGIGLWTGIAIGRGIKVVRNSKSMIFNSPLYGYTGEVMIARQRFELAAAQLERETIKSQTIMFEAQGKVKATLDALMVTTSKNDAKKLQEQFLTDLNAAQEAVFAYALAAGRFGENKRYMAECDALIEASGGLKAQSILESVLA